MRAVPAVRSRAREPRSPRARLVPTVVFTASTATLLVNDHVLKATWPGPVTGKLSDVAGVAMIAVLLTALLRRPGMAFGLTAVAFVGLKSVPVVAVWAAPVLGGVTRTDPTDLMALAVLAPLWRWVHARQDGTGSDQPDWRIPLRIVLVAAAVFATTATSTDDDDAETGYGSFASSGSEAFVWTGGRDGLYRTRDGGVSWRRIRDRTLPARSSLENGGLERCIEGTCWSVEGGRLLRTDGAGSPTPVPLPADIDEPTDAWSRLITVTVGGDIAVLVWFPSEGVLRLTDGETMTWHPVAEFEQSVAVEWTPALLTALMFAGPAAMFASTAAARRSAVRRGLSAGGVVGLMVATAIGLLLVALFTAFVAVPIGGERLVPYFAVPIAVVSAFTVAWAWSAAGRARSSGSPPTEPGAFSRASGSTLPPPEGDERVG